MIAHQQGSDTTTPLRERRAGPRPACGQTPLPVVVQELLCPKQETGRKRGTLPACLLFKTNMIARNFGALVGPRKAVRLRLVQVHPILMVAQHLAMTLIIRVFSRGPPPPSGRGASMSPSPRPRGRLWSPLSEIVIAVSVVPFCSVLAQFSN